MKGCRFPKLWPLVNRIEFVVEACRGKRVLHLGCADFPLVQEQFDRGLLLHQHLTKVARELIGVDSSRDGLRWLRTNLRCSGLVEGDVEHLESLGLQKGFEVVVAGEVLEHLRNPGACMRCIHSLCADGGMLIVTVPNSYSLKAHLRAWFGRELIHPDHLCHHSFGTLAHLLGVYGFRVVKVFGYLGGGRSMASHLVKPLLAWKPYLAEGVGVFAHKI